MDRQKMVFVLALGLVVTAFGVGEAQEQGPEGGAASREATPPAATGGMASGRGKAQAGGGQSQGGILRFKAGEIVGRQLYNSQGKDLGKVHMIGRERSTGNLSAIISVGGFLGYGGTKVAVPIDQLSLREDRLELSSDLSKKALRQQFPGYQEKRYEAVAEDTTLSQVAPSAAAAAELGTGTESRGKALEESEMAAVSFQSLDRNQDGYLVKSEGAGNRALIEQWSTLDKNGDNRIDPKEFAPFEGRVEAERQRTLSGSEKFRALDSNQDGFLSSGEVQRDQEVFSRWESLDTNGDDSLDPIEFSAYEGKPLPPPQLAENSRFKTLDRNLDGYITADEAADNRALMNGWSTLDKNRDNRLDPIEFAAFEQADQQPEGGMSVVPEAPDMPQSQ